MIQKNLLLTGVSSFTGFWFAKKLRAKGFHVICPLPRSEGDYLDVKSIRIQNLKNDITLVFDCPIGSKKFKALLNKKYETICLHAAHVTDYQSSKFDLLFSLSQNLNEIEYILRQSMDNGCKSILWTSSIFEDVIDQTDQSQNIYKVPWLKYALSKKTSFTIVKHLALNLDLHFKRFVIPNPFGPFEDKKITYHLIDAMKKGLEFKVRTPNYVRDMVHVEHLADLYSDQVSLQESEKKYSECRPSEYRMRIIEFAQLLCEKYNSHFGTKNTVSSINQKVFDEPEILVNQEPLDQSIGQYYTEDLWKGYFEHYSK